MQKSIILHFNSKAFWFCSWVL